MDDGPVRFGLWYDFRNPSGRSFEDFYAETLDQIVWAEELGLRVGLADRAPLRRRRVHALAAGDRGCAAGAHHQAAHGTSLMLLPLHDPIRLAEDAATLSILSRGRFDLGLGLGYREIEFEAFHRKVSHRPSLMEEGVELIRRAWAGESLEFEGKRFQLPDVRVAPVPEHTPKLLIGGMNAPSIDRAARLGDGFLSTQNAHQPEYLEALARHGKDVANAAIHAGQWVIIDEDPERTWARIGDHALYQLNEYITWGAFGPPDQVPRFPDRDAIVAGGAFQLWDGPTAVRELVALMRERPQIKDLYFWSQLPGEPVESGSARMQYFMDNVAPQVVAELKETPTGAGT